MSNGVSNAVATARAAYASRRVPATGQPTGDTEDLSDGDDDGFAARPLMAMPMPQQPPADSPPASSAVDADAIVACIRAEVARLDACLVQRDRLAHLLRAADLWDAKAGSPKVVGPTLPSARATGEMLDAQPPRGAAVYPTPTRAAQALLTVDPTDDAETDEDRQHAEELRNWQAGGEMPSWMR